MRKWRMPKIQHGVPTKYGWTVYYPEMFSLGRHTDIGWGCFIMAGEGVTIGDHVQIGGGTYIYSVDTQRGMFGPVRIGENACIGAQSLILPGADIAPFAKVPAHSIVQGDTWKALTARRWS